MNVELDISKLQQLRTKWPETFRKALQNGLDEMLVHVQGELVEVSPVAEGTLASSWVRVTLADDGTSKVVGAVRNTQPYSVWADQGRPGGGKMPPEDAIERWVHRKGIGPYESGVEREEGHTPHKASPPRKPRPAAKARKPRRARGDLSRRDIVFLIRRSIAEHGTYRKDGPPKFVAKTAEASKPKLEEIMAQHMRAFAKVAEKL